MNAWLLSRLPGHDLNVSTMQNLTELAIGIDIGGTNTKYGIVNHRGEILRKGELRTDAYPTVDSYAPESIVGVRSG